MASKQASQTHASAIRALRSGRHATLSTAQTVAPPTGSGEIFTPVNVWVHTVAEQIIRGEMARGGKVVVYVLVNSAESGLPTPAAEVMTQAYVKPSNKKGIWRVSFPGLEGHQDEVDVVYVCSLWPAFCPSCNFSDQCLHVAAFLVCQMLYPPTVRR